MNQEESILYKTVGKKNHFKVPDGYFYDFNNRMIALLPELESGKEKHTPKIIKLRHAHNMQFKIVAAACSLAFILGIGVLSLRQVDYQMAQQNSHNNSHHHKASPQMGATYTATDAAADYSMLDNEDIYAFVSEY